MSDEHQIEKSPYGSNVMSYVIYSIIEVHISQYMLSKIIQKMFGYSLGRCPTGIAEMGALKGQSM
jgi:hypothetical protein